MFKRRRGPVQYLVAGGMVAMLAARKVAEASPNEKVKGRAEAAAHSGPWTHGHATVNGVRLHYAEMGSGPLVILLHGFPQCWYEWRYVMPRLAEHFRVVAPDMRGYNWSDKPEGVEAYTTGAVSSDIVALIEELGERRAHIVGHDWGGAIAWHLGAHHGDHINKLAVINAPHTGALAREWKNNPSEALRSLYILFFQLPLLSEAAIRLGIRRGFGATARVPGAFPPDALDVYENAVSQPGAATAMLNYYRATARSFSKRLPSKEKSKIEVPTLLLWGEHDAFIPPGVTQNLEEWVPDLRVVRIEESGHWAPEERPREVADRLLEFLS